MTMLTPAAGSSQTTYRRPKRGLEGALSIVISGLSCVPEVRCARPTVIGWNVVAPGAARTTTIRLGWPAPFANDSPPYQMLPLASAADIGSQQRLEVSGPASPGTSVGVGIGAFVKLCPPSFVIQAL